MSHTKPSVSSIMQSFIAEQIRLAEQGLAPVPCAYRSGSSYFEPPDVCSDDTFGDEEYCLFHLGVLDLTD